MSTSTGPDTPLPRTPVDIPDHAPAPGTAPTSPPAPSATTADWTDQVTDLIVDSVDKVRARTTGPILEGSKGAVYAVVALMLLTPVLVMGTVGAVRLLELGPPRRRLGGLHGARDHLRDRGCCPVVQAPCPCPTLSAPPPDSGTPRTTTRIDPCQTSATSSSSAPARPA